MLSRSFGPGVAVTDRRARGACARRDVDGARPTRRRRGHRIAIVGLLLATACQGVPVEDAAPPVSPAEAPSAGPGATASGDGDGAARTGPDLADAAAERFERRSGTAEEAAHVRPAWLGTRILPLRDDGLGEIVPTPEELVDRRLPPPPSDLPAPASDGWHASIEPVPDEVAVRSTWHDGCPVTLDELAYVTLTYVGFDGRSHTGELLVHRDVAGDVVDVFMRLHDARFPLEEVRVIEAHELSLPPTGDGNVTTAFVCRQTVEGQRWSDHAYGLAIDVNPFHNPYARDDVVIPELASAYVDRDHHRPGMIRFDDVVVEAFASIGWGWGGDWSSAKDWMHFSASGG